MAMTAWSANVSRSAICDSVNGRRSRWNAPSEADGYSFTEERHHDLRLEANLVQAASRVSRLMDIARLGGLHGAAFEDRASVNRVLVKGLGVTRRGDRRAGRGHGS